MNEFTHPTGAASRPDGCQKSSKQPILASPMAFRDSSGGRRFERTPDATVPWPLLAPNRSWPERPRRSCGSARAGRGNCSTPLPQAQPESVEGWSAERPACR
jgi:hypothetical protein